MLAGMKAFPRSWAFAHGVSRYDLEALLRQGALSRLRRGVYAVPAPGDAAEFTLRAASALVNLDGDPVVSHESAARLWGLPYLGRPRNIQAFWARRAQGTARAYPDLELRHAGMPASNRSEVSGVPVTSPARTVVDVARARGFRAGVVVADAAPRLGRCSREDLVHVVSECAGWPYVRRGRQAVQFADARSATPLESISRVAFHDWGLRAPELQVRVTDAECVDFLWPRHRVIGEADGMNKYRTLQDLWREKARQERLAELGYEFVRWGWREAYLRPDALASRAGRVLIRRIAAFGHV
jgi:hypothetical protein